MDTIVLVLSGDFFQMSVSHLLDPEGEIKQSQDYRDRKCVRDPRYDRLISFRVSDQPWKQRDCSERTSAYPEREDEKGELLYRYNRIVPKTVFNVQVTVERDRTGE